MLKPDCKAFRERYERGQRNLHRDGCADCREFAEFVDGLNRLSYNQPLDDQLRARLRSLADEEEGRLPLMPRMPLLPLPEALRKRLQLIARGGLPKAPPIWIRSPRYAIAASYLLTLLIAGTIGNPAAWASTAQPQIARVGSVWAELQAGGQETWGGIEEQATEKYQTTKSFLRATRSSLQATWTDLAESFRDRETTDEEEIVPEDITPSRGEDR